MHRYRSLLFLFVGLAIRTAVAASAPLPDYLPPDTRVAIGVNVGRLLAAPVLQSARAELNANMSGLLAQSPFAGFDPLKDVDEVLLASTGEGKNPPSLAVIWGRFDVDRLSRNAQQYQGVPVIGTGQGKTQAMALLDSSTAIVGDVPMVRAAIARRGRGGSIDHALAARIEALRSQFDIWGVGDRPAGGPVPSGMPDSLASMDRFEFAVSLGSGLDLTGAIHVSSAQDAEKLTASLRLLEMMAKAQPGASASPKFDIQSQDGTVRLSLSIPEAELEKSIAAQRKSIASALSTRKPTAVTAPVSTPAYVPPAAQPPANPPSVSIPASRAKTVVNSNGDAMVVTLPGPR